MFFKKHFKFVGPLHEVQKKSLEGQYNYESIILVAGTNAEAILAKIGVPLVKKEDYYTIHYRKKGDIQIEANVDIESMINYDVTRHRKGKETINFGHKDNIRTDSESFTTSTPEFSLSAPDLNVKNIYLLLAGRNDEENAILCHQFENKLQADSVKKCIVLQQPIKKTTEEGYKMDTYPVSIHSKFNLSVYCDNDDNFTTVVEFLKEDLEKDCGVYLQKQQENFIQEVKNNIINNFEQKLHEQSDEYFSHRRCCW